MSFLPILALLLAWPSHMGAASWSPLLNPAPSRAGTMIQLTDGTIMVQQSDAQHWMRLTRDAFGSYINGTWSTDIAPMSTPRLYFGSNLLSSGKVFVLGGEYSGTSAVSNWSGTGEIYDPVTKTWSPIAPYPAQPNCSIISLYGGILTAGSAIVTGMNPPSTAGFQAGWSITGTGIAPNTTILSVDSASQITLSQNAITTVHSQLSLSTANTGSTTIGSRIISGLATTTAGYQVGWTVSGSGIANGATITSIDSDSQIHISSLATATAPGVALSFGIRYRPATCFGDGPTMLLPGGKILAGTGVSPSSNIYDPITNTWSAAGNKVYDRSAEEGWVRQSDGTILTYDIFKSISAGTGYAEKYNPATNTWSSVSPADGTANGTLPILSTSAVDDEMGPVVRLQDDRIFAIGANGHTALYTPATNTWAAGPDLTGTLGGSPFLFAADDAPAAVLPNGHVILAADAGNGVTSTGDTTSGSTTILNIPTTVTAMLQRGWPVSGPGIAANTTIQSVGFGQITIDNSATATATGVAIKFGDTFSKPTQIFDFDPVAGTISAIVPALGDTNLPNISSYVTRMLILPTGQLLFSDSTTRLWVYTPDGVPNSSVLPAITQIVDSGGGVYEIAGTQLNGQSAGAAYGDDAEMDENYPIVRLVNAAGNVYYARTFSWSSAGVGSGPGTVNFTLPAGLPDGTYSLIVSGAGISSNPVTFIVGPTGSYIGSMPHIAAQENWTTTITLVNKGTAPAIARLSFFGDDNSYVTDPNGSGPLSLPLAFPQQPAAAGPLLAASFDQTLAANASLIASTAGSQTSPVEVGSAQLSATGALDGFAIFHQIVTEQEAVVPLETRNASSYLLPFDNSNGLVLGVALTNLSAQTATVHVVIRDDTGAQIFTGSLPQLAAGDHFQFGLAAQFSITANKRGTIEFDTPAGARISVLGLRFTPPNNALTTIPALANVGTSGGSFAHLASGGDGWQTTFVLVNTGTSSAQATLSFFSDTTGDALALPLSFPQGNITATTTPAFTQTLPPGATLLVVSSGSPQLLIGSAQLSTNGQVSGFVIYRHNNQEAVVPLESRNANAYILAFDNTGGTATGVAVNAVSTQAVQVPVIVRDDTGTQIASDLLNLAANGHAQFTLVSDKYPGTANIRGTIEFDKPANAQIGALGIRIPPGAAHTYTTLPALAK